MARLIDRKLNLIRMEKLGRIVMKGIGFREYRYKELLQIRDMNTGEFITVDCPQSFFLETSLIDTAYYVYLGKEYRFLLCQAREAGLAIKK